MERKNKIILISTLAAILAVAIGLSAYFIIKNSKSVRGTNAIVVASPSDQITGGDEKNKTDELPTPKEPSDLNVKEDSGENKVIEEKNQKQKNFAIKIAAIQNEINLRPLNEQTWKWRMMQKASTSLNEIKNQTEFMVKKNELEITSVTANDSAGKITLQIVDPNDKNLNGNVVWENFLSDKIKNINSNLMKFFIVTNTSDDKIGVSADVWEKWVEIGKNGSDFTNEFYKVFITERLKSMVVACGLSLTKNTLTLQLYIPQNTQLNSYYKEYHSYEIVTSAT